MDMGMGWIGNRYCVVERCKMLGWMDDMRKELRVHSQCKCQGIASKRTEKMQRKIKKGNRIGKHESKEKTKGYQVLVLMYNTDIEV